MTSAGDPSKPPGIPSKIVIEWADGTSPAPTRPATRNENPAVEKYYFDNMSKINEVTLEAAVKIYDSYLERAKLIQLFATAIGALYTGLLGYVFISGDKAVVEGTERLPKSGIIPTAFLAAAIVFAAAFTSFLAPSLAGTEEPGDPMLETDVLQRRNSAVRWITALRWWRIGFLQLSVISLGLGVGFLPIAFLRVSEDRAFEFAQDALVGVLLLWVIGWLIYFSVRAFWPSLKQAWQKCDREKGLADEVDRLRREIARLTGETTTRPPG